MMNPHLHSTARAVDPPATPTGNARDALRGAVSWLWEQREIFLIGLILLVAGLAHAVNMFAFPSYEMDEGTYMGQAWAATHWKLSHYTYWYDHAPWGWFQIAGWAKLTGGFHAFGNSVNSGRALMLVLQLGTVYLLYRTARALTSSALIATVTSLTFALSAFGIYYHRRVLLDNIATFWVMLAVYLLVRDRLTLTRVWLSAAALGVAVMSKEVALIFLPAMAALVYFRSDRSQRLFATAGWLALATAIVSSYVLLALLKLELFPHGTFLGADYEHVSLVESIRAQAARGSDGGLFDLNSQFWVTTLNYWIESEPLLVIGGTFSALYGILRMRSQPVMGIFGLMTLSFWVFLARGGTVIAFYLLPLLPLLALNLGLLLHAVFARLNELAQTRSPDPSARTPRSIQAAAALGCVLLILPGYNSSALAFDTDPLTLWKNQQVLAQEQATRWMMLNAPQDAGIIMDAYMWVELHDPPSKTFLAEDASWPRAHWYSKANEDPQIREGVFEAQWQNVDYLVTTRQMRAELVEESATMPFVGTTMQNASIFAQYDTGGNVVDIRRVNKLGSIRATDNPILRRTWESYKQRFVFDGRVIDPDRKDETLSEGQAYALLRAVYMDDRQTFDQVWGWTGANLQVRGEDNLIAWRWGPLPEGGYGVLDMASAADSDQDIALALLLASKRWGEPAYQTAALKIVDSIWEQETVAIDGRRYPVAGSWARGDGSGDIDQPVINPSYLAPHTYRIFAEADPEHDWQTVMDSSYELLLGISDYPELGGESGLIPDWLMIDQETGELLPATPLGERAGVSSFDAIRVYWQMTIDWVWNQDDRARQVVDAFHRPVEEIQETGAVSSSYQLDGTPNGDQQSASTYAGLLGGLLFSDDQGLVHRVFAERILNTYAGLDPDRAYWDDANNYYVQNWAWFATLLMDGGMSNLWAGETAVEWDTILPERYP